MARWLIFLMSVASVYCLRCWDCNSDWYACPVEGIPRREHQERRWVSKLYCNTACFIREENNGRVIRGCADGEAHWMPLTPGAYSAANSTMLWPNTLKRLYICATKLCNNGNQYDQISTDLVEAWSCNFDNDTCDVTSGNKRLEWVRQTGPTPSSNTGPKSDHTTGGGYYMYVEASDNNDTDYSMTSPRFDKQDSCIDFWYHMYSSTDSSLAGKLKLKVKSNGSTILWERSGSQSPFWKNGRFQVTVADHIHGNKFKLIFRANNIQNDESDIAVDDIRVYAGICP